MCVKQCLPTMTLLALHLHSPLCSLLSLLSVAYHLLPEAEVMRIERSCWCAYGMGRQMQRIWNAKPSFPRLSEAQASGKILPI
jgi:hypothetical protein